MPPRAVHPIGRIYASSKNQNSGHDRSVSWDKPAHESRREIVRSGVRRVRPGPGVDHRPPSKTDTRGRPVTGVPSPGQAAVLPRSKTCPAGRPAGQVLTRHSPHRIDPLDERCCRDGTPPRRFIVHGAVLAHTVCLYIMPSHKAQTKFR